MTYASTSIDRRAEYYARCAGLIASDPLDFYTRAEKGRRYLAQHFHSSPAPAAGDLFDGCSAWWTDHKANVPLHLEGRPGLLSRLLAA
jgi:hypothetical protein